MSRSMFSQNWFRVTDLRPRLRSHARVHRQRYRGATWYVIQDDQTGRFHRLSPAANHMIALMNGRRTIAEIWAATTKWLGTEAEPPTQDEVIRLLSQLHQADLLAGDVPPDIDELAYRADTRSMRMLMARLKNPLALRVPMIDPDRFLEATMALVRPAFTVFGLFAWLAVVIAGAAIASQNWVALTEGLVDRVLLRENLILLALVYPVIKAIHELGHGYAVKNWGGQVHEMGLMFLVLIPIPYVDASASSAFSSKWQRALVGAAGILVELFIAGLAMIVWVTVEPGVVRAAALNAALIGGVSTLLFNGNPLLRFDGYYVLADLIEIPNLGARANKHFFYLIKRYLFGLHGEQSPATARGERTWFVVYAVAAFLYRLAIMVGIALFVAGQLFFVGVALAIWAVGIAFVWPLIKGAWWLVDSPDLRGRRRRALGLSTMAAGALTVLAIVVPVPYSSTAEGVVWVPERAVVRAGTDGFVVAAGATETAEVAAGDILFRLEDPALGAMRDLLLAQRAELALRLEREIVADRVRGAILREQVVQAEAALVRIDERIAGLTGAADRAGRLLVPDADDLAGRFVRRGALIGYLIAPGDPVVRVMVPQSSADLVRRRLDGVQIVLADAVNRRIAAEVVRQVPKAQLTLPSAALGTEGGGRITIDPTAGDRVTALEPHFQFDLAADLPDHRLAIGQRVHVRFDHGSEPIAWRLVRSLRQLFLSQFDV